MFKYLLWEEPHIPQTLTSTEPPRLRNNQRLTVCKIIQIFQRLYVLMPELKAKHFNRSSDITSHVIIITLTSVLYLQFFSATYLHKNEAEFTDV